MIDLVKSGENGNGNGSKGFTWILRYGGFLGVLLALGVQTVSFIWFIAALRNDVDAKADREAVSLIRSDLTYIREQLVDRTQFTKLQSEVETLRVRVQELAVRQEGLNNGGSRALQILAEQVKNQTSFEMSTRNAIEKLRSKQETAHDEQVELTSLVKQLIMAISPHPSIREFEKRQRQKGTDP